MSFSIVSGFVTALALAAAAVAGGAGNGGSAAMAADAPAPQPTGALRLAEALRLALTSSPELAPFSLEIRAAEARALQAGLLPNPEAELHVEDVLGTGSFEGGRQAQVTLQLSQLVELGGKRKARIAVAGSGRDVASAEYEVKRIEVLAEATKRFLDVLERQHSLDLVREAVELDRATLDVVRRRITAGAGSLLEEKRAQVTLAQSRVSDEDARHELAVARTTLAAVWGAPKPTFERVEAELFARRPVPEWAKLERNLDGSPEILLRTTERRLRDAELRLAEARRIPDVTLLAGPRRLEGADEQALVFGLSAPLPLFDRNQGSIAEASTLVEKTGAERRAAEVRLRALLYELWQELTHAGHVLDVLERDLLPAAEATLALSREGFERGRFSHLELLDAGRAFLEARRRRIEAAASFHRFALEIERVTATPIDEPEAPPLGEGGTP